ncbi:MAG: bifunctional UDP-N-acetylglucosamine diphosphorylase/glucosamine-1-phosphate N-acetyltransferase GlmU [Gammaproteobacteria bacterium]
MSLNVVILAAGEGKRMHSTRPKVLAPLAGAPLLAHVLAAARTLEPGRIVLVAAPDGGSLRAAFPDRDLQWAEQKERLGTADALAAALPLLPAAGSVLVLYGDVPLIRTQTLVPLAAAADEGALALLTVRFPDPQGYGRIVRNAAGAIERIVEERDASAAERAITEVNTGVIVAPAQKLREWLPRIGKDNVQGEYYLTDVVALAIGDNIAVRAIEAADAGETRGVNNRLELAAAETELRRRRARELMAAGAVLADPARIDLRGRVVCGHDVFIDVNTVFEGSVELGDDVRIGAGVIIRDSVVGAGTEIRSYSIVEHARVGANAIIGPYARLRPGSELADETHVGNFVEVKNTKLGRGSKANHLAYLGDAEIGERVNVGAGVITCNYDGARKHKTVIGDDAFIGSDCPLVAPVEIGAGATIGAGSTITEDVPADTLTIARAPQTIVKGWKRPKKKDKE